MELFVFEIRAKGKLLATVSAANREKALALAISTLFRYRRLFIGRLQLKEIR